MASTCLVRASWSLTVRFFKSACLTALSAKAIISLTWIKCSFADLIESSGVPALSIPPYNPNPLLPVPRLGLLFMTIAASIVLAQPSVFQNSFKATFFRV